ncbi:hypothetical protein J416_09084 [Gracilibacillus halophilus YIM-C55.5]|uniref:DUF58 domain-containing protein n=1 Tax=Gracilibacillus halophilus YIM-C55.5 TaxID=1308866 RepID=N4W8X4_9BACI|nr:DUF58 domain-containing protein [Gracilibacillus halophilus]ENH96753.1 hypothetical protein J416_09084 [Gracilibacillus halophilus YIM-C55.5]
MKAVIKQISKSFQLLLLFGILFAFAMFQGGFVSWFLFYSVTPFLLYMLVINFYPIQKWTVSRDVTTDYVQAGQSVTVTITVKRRIRFPLFFALIEDDLPATLQYQDVGRKKYYQTDVSSYKRNRIVQRIVYPLMKKHFTYQYHLPHLPRGKHVLSGITIQVGDPFGFVQQKKTFPLEKILMVYPAEREMNFKQQVFRTSEGSSPSMQIDDRLTNVVSGVREYTPGDRFSWIDWKSTARMNKVMTKEFEQEKDTEIAVILPVMGQKQEHVLAFEAAVEWSVSLLQALRSYHQTSSFMTIGQKSKLFHSHELRFHFPVVQNYLATVQLEEKDDVVTDQLGSIPVSAYHAKTIFILCSLDDGLLQKITQIHEQNHAVLVFFIAIHQTMNQEEQQRIETLKARNISVQMLTEKELAADRWEVSPAL